MSNIHVEFIKENLVSHFDDIISLLMDVYVGTGGKYPAMEWLSKEEKPKIDSPTFREDFIKKYGEFLKWRLAEEIDEIFLAYSDKRLIGCVGLNYKLEGKEIPWIPAEFMNNNFGFIELFVVHPDWQGKGVGRSLFTRALARLKELNRKGCVVTFPNLEAISFYESFGGVKVKEYNGYVMYCF